MRIWTRADIPALCALVDAALPGEQLSADEIVTACFDDPDAAAVLALPDGEGSVALVARPGGGDRPAAHLLLLAVEPAAQGEGRGRRLLRAAEEWAFDATGAAEIRPGGMSPFGLWPGVDVRWTRSLCLFEAGGYADRGVALTLSCPSTHWAAPPRGVEIRRVLEDDDADAALVWCDRHLPGRRREVTRGLEHGSCFVAVGAEGPVGVICHSVNRVGWVGPVGVSAGVRRRGIGRALLGAVCRDLRAAGHPDAVISPGAPLEFFVRSAGASVSRVFSLVTRTRD